MPEQGEEDKKRREGSGSFADILRRSIQEGIVRTVGRDTAVAVEFYVDSSLAVKDIHAYTAALQRMFASDHADGTLEQMLLGATPLGMIVGAKVLAHWLVSGLPLVLISPVLALQFDFPQELLGVLALSLALGTPVLSLIGAIGAALTLGLRGGGALLSLLVLPLYVPVLIIGTGTAEAAVSGLGGQAQLLLLGALLVFAAAFAPWAAAVALRISTE